MLSDSSADSAAPRQVYLDVAGRMHSLYRLLLEQPPEGYVATRGEGRLDRMSANAAASGPTYKAVTEGLARVVPPNLVKAALERGKRPPPGTALTFANGHLVFRDEPWVVDVEFVSQLAGYDFGHFVRWRRVVEKVVERDACRAIMSWTRAGAETVKAHLPRVAHKVHVTPLAVPPRPAPPPRRDDAPTTILFVGSVNIPGQFGLKGGYEVFAAFEELRKMHPDLRLVVRSDLPPEVRARHGRDPNVRIVDTLVSAAALDAMFHEASVFWFPSYNTPGLALLDAMSHALPIVTTDVWANGAMVEDGVNGRLIPAPRSVPYKGANVPAWGERRFVRSLASADPAVVSSLVEATAPLLGDPSLRRRMGEAGRERVTRGEYSVASRNACLKRVFDSALG